MSTPNEIHRAKCEEHRGDVERLSVPSGRAVPSASSPRTTPPRRRRPSLGEPAGGPDGRRADDDIDLSDLVDAAPGAVTTTLDRLAQAFPGAELIEESD